MRPALLALLSLALGCQPSTSPPPSATSAPTASASAPAVSSSAPSLDEGSQDLSLTVHVVTEWVELPQAALPPGSQAAVAIRRAVNPDTRQPYDDGYATLGADPRQLTRGFHLDATKLFVGEPIVAEHRVGLRGPGTWKEPIGGNYRARGRDDNFFFVMVHADGTRVADPYGPSRMHMGGLSTTVDVTRDA